MNNEIISEVDVADLDLIYLSYDEEQKEEFWLKIKNMLPWAKRVDGVKGSDAAHKAAAELSTTERFILIDGDNIPDISFFDERLRFTASSIAAQFRWRAQNYVNGLHYGNGGISCWTRNFVLNMRTHEHSTGSSDTNIEFCFDPLYWALHNCYSVTYPNASPRQAWRAGFREGVKLCTRSGTPTRSRESFRAYVWPRNLRNLQIWQTVGRDVENGWWAMHGARCGTHYLMLRDWDYIGVRDFEHLDALWELHKNDDEGVYTTITHELKQYLGLDLVELDAPSSAFFKRCLHSKWFNRDIMLRELDVIRAEEGW